MLNKIVFSLVLASVCFLNSQYAEATFKDAIETDYKYSTAKSSDPSPILDTQKKGWVFRDILRNDRSIQLWLGKSEKHPRAYRVIWNPESDVWHLEVYRN